MSSHKHQQPLRNAFERVLNAALMKGLLAGISYRLGGLGRVRVTRRDVDVGAGRLAQPLRIGFASDFHAGPTTHPALFDDLLPAAEVEAFAEEVDTLRGTDKRTSSSAALLSTPRILRPAEWRRIRCAHL